MDLHELARRSQSGAAALDWSVQVELCRACHEWVTTHPAEAVAEGWAMWGWQYRAARRAEAEASYVTASAAVSSYAMPRPPSGRKPVTVKLSDAGIAAIKQRADEWGTDQSEAHRRMLAYADQHMPRPRMARPQPKENSK